MKVLPSGFLLLIVTVIFYNSVAAQNNQIKAIDAIAGPLIENIRNGGNEIILLQTDKYRYAAGETIWLKAFLIDSITGRFSNKHKIIFFDMVNEKDSSFQQLIVPVSALQTDASFHINENLKSGNYFIRAYTNEMALANRNNIGLKAICILNKNLPIQKVIEVNAENSLQKEASKYYLEIYPEGGSLISGTDCVVAFRLHDQFENPIQADLMIKDSKNKEIVKFNTNKTGLGKCTFSPSLHGKYSVFVKNKEIYDSITKLPAINPFAIQFAVTEQNQNHITARVMMEDSVFRPDYTTYLLVLQNDSLCMASVGKGMYELNVFTSRLPSGMLNLMLFDEEKQLVSVRKLFNPETTNWVKASTDKNNYNAREKVLLNIALQESAGKPVVAALTVSVTDLRFSDTASLYQFMPDLSNQLTAKDADLEMLVSPGKLPYNISANKGNSENNIAEYFTLKGKVINKKNEPVSGEKLILMSKEKSAFVIQDTTDLNGIFEMRLPEFADSTEFDLQLSGKRDNLDTYEIQYQPIQYPQFATPVQKIEEALNLVKKSETTSSNSSLDSLVWAFNQNILPPVVVTATINKNNKNKKQKSSNILTREMLMQGGYNEIGQAILRSGKFHFSSGFLINGAPNGFAPTPEDEPIIVVDGVQVSLATTGDPAENSPVMAYLKTIATVQVEYVKILTASEAGIYGVRSGHGVIEIHTATSIDIPIGSGNITKIFPKGYHIPLAFPFPDYSNKEVLINKAPDLRTTIYWNCNLITDLEGKLSESFYTADTPATYLITITGITTAGKRIYKTLTINRN